MHQAFPQSKAQQSDHMHDLSGCAARATPHRSRPPPLALCLGQCCAAAVADVLACAEETTQITYDKLREVRSVNRGFGLWGDMVRFWPVLPSLLRLSATARHASASWSLSQFRKPLRGRRQRRWHTCLTNASADAADACDFLRRGAHTSLVCGVLPKRTGSAALNGRQFHCSTVLMLMAPDVHM